MSHLCVCHLCHLCHACIVSPVPCARHIMCAMRVSCEYVPTTTTTTKKGGTGKDDQGEEAAAVGRHPDRAGDPLLHEKIQVLYSSIPTLQRRVLAFLFAWVP